MLNLNKRSIYRPDCFHDNDTPFYIQKHLFTSPPHRVSLVGYSIPPSGDEQQSGGGHQAVERGQCGGLPDSTQLPREDEA